YMGEQPGVDTASNLNIRLIRNRRGYAYRGAIHEQIYNVHQEVIDKTKVKIEDIIIYHYGYLNKMTIEKDKSTRNMKILEKILNLEPKDNFHLFNMGNEYLRIKNYNKALEYYEKAYRDFSPELAHSPKLLFKLVLTLDGLQMYKEEMKILNEGLGYYPKFVDLEYLKACLYHKQKKYTLAIQGFEKCLAMEASPLTMRNINDVEGYRSYYALGEIHSELGDDEKAYEHYISSLRAKSSFHLPLYRIGENLIKRGKDIETTKVMLERFFGKTLNAGAYGKLGNIFFFLKKYDVALYYFLKAHQQAKENENIYFNLGMTQFYLKNFKEAYVWFEKIKEGSNYEEAIYKRSLCKLLSNDIETGEYLLEIAAILENNKKREVYQAFANLLKDCTGAVLSYDEEESKIYVKIIFRLLQDLLQTAKPEVFEKSLQLLNLVESDAVLLELAKLYYCYGYYQLVYQEFIRSISLFQKIDKDGLEMMANCLDFLRDAQRL
ncbi:MAG: hypothetical protein AB2421_20370, partial [Thermotaleaceae bacterium]